MRMLFAVMCYGAAFAFMTYAGVPFVPCIVAGALMTLGVVIQVGSDGKR